MEPGLIEALLADYIGRAESAFVAADRPVPRVVPVAPGTTPAWDDGCGLMYSRLVSVTPVVDTQMRGNSVMPCGINFYIVTVAIAVVRCVAVVDDAARAPTAAQVYADGSAMLADLETLEQVIRCAPTTRSIISAQPLPEQGGLSGIEWIFTLRLPACDCPPDPAPEPED